MKNIILATSSERKKRLFSLLGVTFINTDHTFDEKSITTREPTQHVVDVAKGKVESIKSMYPNSIVIGLDTVVAYNDKIFGKPKNNAEALNMLVFLNDSIHHVITGVYICDTSTDTAVYSATTTNMHFKKFSENELLSYVNRENVLDVAGAYNHEELGCILLKKIDGDYYNSIGMPLSVIADELKKFDINILQ